MKLSWVLPLLTFAGCLFLVHSNPNDKGRFVTFISQKATQTMCDAPSNRWCSNLCTAARPLAIQATRGVFALYTQEPRDYLFFTIFQSKLPGLEIRAIGIANTFLVAPVDVDALQLCDLTGSLFDEGWQNLQRRWEEFNLGEEATCL